MHEIRPGLWLGSLQAACDQQALLDAGVTHILSLASPSAAAASRQRCRLPPSEEDPFMRLVVAVDDATSARLDRHFNACSAFIKECHGEGGVILVHCHAGQSRSPTIVAAYLMAEHNWTSSFAMDYVRQRRAKVHPNAGFLSQLRSLEAQMTLGMHAKLEAVLNIPAAFDSPGGVFGDAFHDTTKDALHPASLFDMDNTIADAKKSVIVDTYATAEALAKSAKLRARLGALRGGGTFKPPSRKQRFS